MCCDSALINLCTHIYTQLVIADTHISGHHYSSKTVNHAKTIFVAQSLRFVTWYPQLSMKGYHVLISSMLHWQTLPNCDLLIRLMRKDGPSSYSWQWGRLITVIQQWNHLHLQYRISMKIALCQKLDLINVHITVFDARPRLCFVDGESRMCFICLNGGQLNIHLEYSDNVTAAFTVLTLLVWAFVKQADANG